MENLSKCDWEKYLETLTQDRKSFLVENEKKDPLISQRIGNYFIGNTNDTN